MTEKVGRARECRLGPASLGEVTEWIEGYRRASEGRLDRVGRRPVWPDGFVARSDGVIDWLPPDGDGIPDHGDQRHRVTLELHGCVTQVLRPT